MKRLLIYISLAAAITACKKDGNPHNLPDVSPGNYAGKIDGYSSSDEVYAAALVAYWPFDGSKNEKISGTAPTASAGDAYVDGGVLGKALSLNAGYVYYATQFPAFKTDALKSFTVSQWVQILNNGSKKTMLVQLARPGIFNGNINVVLETNRYPATELEKLTIHPTFTAANNGMQDNLNTANGSFPFLSPKIGMTKWTHIVVTYDGVNNNIQIWADGVRVGVPAFQNRGANFFKSHEPNEVIIGGNYNTIPGKTVNADVSFAPMTGNIDEVRIYNACLTDAHIKALYKLGLEKK
ncbi:LamG domain-containing protein [Chitinophaga lutea]|uniref:LamG domain-containing protein n=1 Tax=Chitinophaga lutea TaxID=2488634 RepID=A0A3N4P9S8_9BACT|nr:LamG-like jellyroll fold domain-containing protein [Chitinophaga lutea]RPE05413.1 LamG domain-containing protein [Chitinophaga lutea]